MSFMLQPTPAAVNMRWRSLDAVVNDTDPVRQTEGKPPDEVQKLFNFYYLMFQKCVAHEYTLSDYTDCTVT